MSANRVCWSRDTVDFATQVDVGGFETDDARADAMFRAIHQPLPVRQQTGAGEATVSEGDVLRIFTRPITSNEPLLLFVTGDKGTGKSHLVRWLKSQLGPRPGWHVVYIEKRNTSLRRVTERILNGIDTPRARALRQELHRAASEITSDEEAMSALLGRLDQLVRFDPATEIGTLPGVSPEELEDYRRQAHRLLGDYTFCKVLSAPGGPVHRIVRLARGGSAPSDGISDTDLHLTEADLDVDPVDFDEQGQDLQSLIASLTANRDLRSELAAVCDWYLPRAKAQVFIGQGTSLLDVFEDVREEIASRGQELCLLIEDLVLLHGIDLQLAQALTIPASGRLCRLRAAIAVTDGYLRSMDTFKDRGLLFTMDLKMSAIGQDGLRDFAARYLNAGRLTADWLESPTPDVRNACLTCPDLARCHETFGASSDRYGLYPFNGTAIDRLIKRANPGDFRPREILREVIRAPLEVAEEELPPGGRFPSERFAQSLDPQRTELDPTVRDAIKKANPASPQAEMSLRAFYALAPPTVDADMERIARYLGDRLSAGVADPAESPGRSSQSRPRIPDPRPQSPDEVRRWTDEKVFLAAPTALRIRRWICETLIAQIQNGPYGVPVRKVKGKSEWRIGSHTLRLTDVDIERSYGGGAVEPQHPFRITATDENAALIRGILAATSGDGLGLGSGEWFFNLQARMSNYASQLAGLAVKSAGSELPPALEALTILRHVSKDPGKTVRAALTPMLKPELPQALNPNLGAFLRDVRTVRERALTVIRDYATSAKGMGNASILDTGALYKDLQSRLSVLEVEGAPDGLLGNLRAAQSQAASRAWSRVRAAVHRVGVVLDPEEDLGTAFATIDRLVDVGHAAGKLPRADSRDRYWDVRSEVSPHIMETFRRLVKKTAQETGPGDIWDISDDPVPQLEALARYATAANEVLDGINSKVPPATVIDPSDVGALIEEFRELADLLDAAASAEAADGRA